MKLKLAFSTLMLLVTILSACTSTTPTISPVSTPSSPVSNPQTISPVATPLTVSPQPGMGAVIGQLIDIRTGQPATKTVLYLEQTVEHQAPPLLYGPLSGQPRTDSLLDGGFAFNNVPPGEYILVLYSPLDILYYQNPEGQAVFVKVQAGEVLDLGRVEYFIP